MNLFFKVNIAQIYNSLKLIFDMTEKKMSAQYSSRSTETRPIYSTRNVWQSNGHHTEKISDIDLHFRPYFEDTSMYLI